MTQKIKTRFQDYARYHAHPKNVISHYIGIPMIALSLLGLLSLVQLGVLANTPINLGMVLALVAILFYLSLDMKIGVLFSFVVVGLYFLGLKLSLPVLIALQVVGWISQYIGHLIYEKKSPAFYKNIEHLLIGPIWIFAKLIKYK